jgi:hypothetical protein
MSEVSYAIALLPATYELLNNHAVTGSPKRVAPQNPDWTC